jgi:hypothetical protein
MKCDKCGNRFPYAEIFDMKNHCWYYFCKQCYKEDRKNINIHGYYELTKLERFYVSFGLTKLKWILIEFWWKVKK